MKLLVAFSAKEKEKRKLLSLIEPLIKLLGEETMIDDILLTLLNLADQESVRVFIIEEGGIPALEGICCYGSPTQRETTIEILKQINLRRRHSRPGT